MAERIICIGDIHGCFDELMMLLDKLNYDESSDTLCALGDLVDRGPDSAKVVKWFREAAIRTNGKVQCVMGNHDDKHFRYFKHALKRREHPNYNIPMRPFNLDKLQVYNSLDDEDLSFLGTLPPLVYLEEQNWVVVHAGLEPKKDLDNQDVGKVSHIRFLNPGTMKTVSLDDNYLPPSGSIYWTEVYDLKYNVVYGHNVHSLTSPEITVKKHGPTLVGIDTGACFGGMLTAFLVPEKDEPVSVEKHIVQVPSLKAYSRSLLHSKE